MKRAVIILALSLLVVMVGGLIFYKLIYNNYAHHTLSKTVQEKKLAEKRIVDDQGNIQKATAKNVLKIPEPYHSVIGMLQQTIYVGTADHPTINGGIINAPGVVVNRDLPQLLYTERKNNKENRNESDVVLTANPVFNFQDNWATSERVGLLLRSAAQEGKLSYVLKKTDEMGLPANLAILPMVESNYQSNAVSTKGAAGAWQLMPSTAKDYGLNQQDRFQFPIATDAALKLLNSLHQQFGNWTLAFAAYNAGSQRVKIALSKNPDARIINELDLPLETKTYVKRIMNLNKIMISMEEHRV